MCTHQRLRSACTSTQFLMFTLRVEKVSPHIYLMLLLLFQSSGIAFTITFHYRYSCLSPAVIFLLIIPLWILCVINVPCLSLLCYLVCSSPSCYHLQCWERADLLAFLCVMFSCVFFLLSHMVSRGMCDT